MKLRLVLPLAIALAVAGCEKSGSSAAAPSPPVVQVGESQLRPARVVDAAGLLSATEEEALSRRLATLEQRTSDQLAVVTLPSLGGRSIEETGLRLGNGWGIGQTDKDNGALLIVAPNEREVRIEVGRGLEQVLTNETCAQIIRDDLLPMFRQARYSEGIEKGTSSVIAILLAKSTTARKVAA